MELAGTEYKNLLDKEFLIQLKVILGLVDIAQWQSTYTARGSV